MLTDEQRGRYGRWLRRERLARGWSAEETRERLARKGYRIGESSYAEWESGRKRPSRDALPHLVDLFGEPDPELPPQEEAATSSPDLTALVAELRAQNELLREQNRIHDSLVHGIALIATSLERSRTEAPSWFLTEGGGMTDSVHVAIRSEVDSAVRRVLSALRAGTRGPGNDPPQIPASGGRKTR